jgi:hypothetical protein
MDDLKRLIREVPDFPKPGINFYDITTVLKDKVGFRTIIDRLTEQVAPLKPDYVLGIEARGFIFAPALAYHLGAGFVPVRKPRIRNGYAGGPSGCGSAGSAGCHCRRSFGDRWYESGCIAPCGEARRQGQWARFCNRVGLPEGPRSSGCLQRDFAHALLT